MRILIALNPVPSAVPAASGDVNGPMAARALPESDTVSPLILALAAIASSDQIWVLAPILHARRLRERLAPSIPRERVLAFDASTVPELAGVDAAGVRQALHDAAVHAISPDVVCLPDWQPVPDVRAAVHRSAGSDAPIPTVLRLHPDAGPALRTCLNAIRQPDAAVRLRAHRMLGAIRQAACVLTTSPDLSDLAAAAAHPMRPQIATLPVDAGDGACASRLYDAIRDCVPAVVEPGCAGSTATGQGRPARGGRLPRLALIAPLPPARTGVAAYVAETLPFLARHYDIELITDQTEVSDEWPIADFPVYDYAAFERSAQTYDRILFHLGNSRFHIGMIPLLRRHGGTVLLHDLVLSDLLHHLERSGEAPFEFTRQAYQSHGWPMLRIASRDGVEAAVRASTCSRWVFNAADRVILHSRYARERAEADWGQRLALSVVPHPRVMPVAIDREGARQRLGLAPDAFVVCAFGVLAPSKCNDRLIDAWLRATPGRTASATLVFVGAPVDADWQRELATRAGADANVRFTGHLDDACWRDWLAAADAAVQLRAESRGESSGTILDCLAHRLPTVINAHGPAADFPADAVLMLEDRFEDAALVAALDHLHVDPGLRAALSDAGGRFVATRCDPVALCADLAAAIASSNRPGAGARGRVAAGAFARLLDGVRVPPDWRFQLSAAIAANAPGGTPRQLLVDITGLARHDLRSGIQRVVRSVLDQMFAQTPPGWRVEPVHLDRGFYRYARQYVGGWFGVAPDALPDQPVDARCGDVFLGLDLVTDGVYRARPMLSRWRARGVSLQFVVYDLLPVQFPAFFPASDAEHYRNWLATVVQRADRLICISRATADALRGLLSQRPGPGPDVRTFRLGADIDASLPTGGITDAQRTLLASLASRKLLLMVGTVEPRKGHAQALDAFELLWSRGLALDLVIVGRPGWMVESLIERLRTHTQAGRHLHWLEGASDELLERLYQCADGLLMASEGEGFGLPLIEAAQHRLPIIARDLPVFREVADGHAFFFDARDGQELAAAITRWFALHDSGEAPPSDALPWATWAESTGDLLAAVMADQ